MRRMRIQLDERTFDKLRRRALEKGCSISSLARDLLARSLGSRGPRQRFSIEGFTFIAAGRSHQGRLPPVSERHDEALAIRLPERKEEGRRRLAREAAKLDPREERALAEEGLKYERLERTHFD